jgi:DNA polymerase III alpha subunit (gram-positive type)
MILLKDILTEAKLYSYSTDELLEKFLKFDGKTLVFLDTETTGLDPNDFYVQLTQLAMMAVDGSTWEIKDEFSAKVELNQHLTNLLNVPNSKEVAAYEKEDQKHIAKYKKPIVHPRELLDKTQYHKVNPGEKKMSEIDALKECERFLQKYPDAVIVAHNAFFDMKTVQTRRRVNGLAPISKHPVLDTLAVARYFFVPTLLSLDKDEEAKQFLEKLLAKTKFKSYSTTLGKLADVFKVTADNWHDASADIKMLFQIIQKLIEYLKMHKNVDIRKQQGVQAKRLRRMR